MKQLVLAVVMLLSAAPSALAQTDLKLGHIDRQKLMLMLPERKDAEAKMQKFAEELERRLKAMGAEYQSMVEQAQRDGQNMTQTQQQAMIRDINEMEQRIQAAQEKAQEDLARQEEELLRPMVERTNKAIDEVAKANNFTYVFDTSTGFVLYFDKGEDIMPLVKTKLGI
ncbi:MAG: OmpH family outer membrane protein [Flavobacteriales bacterium]|nr:OmpH family outer membrane protein [Flavobacteriales bacterium]